MTTFSLERFEALSFELISLRLSVASRLGLSDSWLALLIFWP